jgi:hypothetical protein
MAGLPVTGSSLEAILEQDLRGLPGIGLLIANTGEAPLTDAAIELGDGDGTWAPYVVAGLADLGAGAALGVLLTGPTERLRVSAAASGGPTSLDVSAVSPLAP